MDESFWHHRWESGNIGFHQPDVNPLLIDHFEQLSLAEGSRVFVPLCGKTLDIGWLLSRGYRVAGVELNEKAVAALFEELGTDPDLSKAGKLTHYRADRIDIFAGDLFDISPQMVGRVDATYDRAALVALLPEIRRRYAEHLITITGNAPQLLISFVYDQAKMNGPPFSVDREELQRHYGHSYELTLLDQQAVPGGLKGICEATEKVWLLEKK